ncbi:Gfo/Idh/MocA family protein [Arthrobacter sp. GCM10020060]|nr:Gfo/Idh/MocA family oxidoreductase [Arthrobacter sp. MAHUQ-56]
MPVIPDPKSGPALRWGVLAPGDIAGRVVNSLHRLSRQRVIAVGSRSTERAEQFRSQHGIERAYSSYARLVADKDVDAVYIASPHSFHAEHALLAIASGKHVLIEKPLARNAHEARTVFAAGRDAGVLVMEAMWMRFLPQAAVIKQLLRDGHFGRIVNVSADHGQYFEFNPNSRLFAPSLAGGAMLDLGIYPLSFMQMVLGYTTQIAAVGTLTSTGVDATVNAILQYRNAMGVLGTTLEAQSPTTATIVGTDARLELRGRFYMPTEMGYIRRDGCTRHIGPFGLRAGDGRVYQFTHFAQLVADQQPESPMHPADDVLETLMMSDKIRAVVGAIPPEENPLQHSSERIAAEAARKWREAAEIEDFELARIFRPAIPDGLLNVLRRQVEMTHPRLSKNELQVVDGYLRRQFWATALDHKGSLD